MNISSFIRRFHNDKQSNHLEDNTYPIPELSQQSGGNQPDHHFYNMAFRLSLQGWGWFSGRSLGMPLIVDMDGEGIELAGLNESIATFDFDDDNYLERTAWAAGDDAVLMFDFGGDDSVTQSTEIAFAQWAEADGETIIGSPDDDVLYGGLGDDVISGGDGDDQLYGNDGDDELSGDAGDDELYGSWGDDELYGGAGDDELDGSWGDDELYGGEGDDELDGGDGDDELYGGAGNDELDGSWGDDKLYGGAGNDELDGSWGDDKLYGGAGNDELDGSWGDDKLYGNEGNDELDGNWGDDKLYGGAGDDELDGSLGDDELYGGDGDDELYGGVGDDELDGSWGDDKLYGGAGDDELDGSWGDDELYGNEGDDELDGNHGDDELYGGAGDDELDGSHGDDELYGGAGDDELGGSHGDDELYGGVGDDELDGSHGDDELYGGAGDDELYGSHGDDELFGGSGDDTYIYSFYYFGGGQDTIQDSSSQSVSAGGIDTLHFSSAGISVYDIMLNRSGDDMVVTLRDSVGSITIAGWANPNNRIEFLSFADGTRLEINHIENNTSHELIKSNGRDWLVGTDQGDFLSVGNVKGIGNGQDSYSEVIVLGGGGDDIIIGVEGDDTMFGGSGRDQMFGGGGNDELVGRDGDDRLYGGRGRDLLRGDDGNDTLYGQDGNDHLSGGEGDDVLIGGRGNDGMYGRSGDDTYVYRRGDGIDSIVDWGRDAEGRPNGGVDTLRFGPDIALEDLYFAAPSGSWRLFVGIRDLDNPNRMLGDLQDKLSIGGWKDAALRIENFEFGSGLVLDMSEVTNYSSGYSDDDTLDGTVGVDVLSGGGGDDVLTGFSGNDILIGGSGDDVIKGGAGDDDLFGGRGDDKLEGGDGDDVYFFKRGDGHETLEDSGSGAIGTDETNPGGDRLLFGADIAIEDLILQRSGDDLMVYLRDRDNPNTALNQLDDNIRIRDWATSENRIEVFQFLNAGFFIVSEIINTQLGKDVLGEDPATPFNDTLTGTAFGDWLDGQGGVDTLYGGEGGDFLFGRTGNDLLYGQGGDDFLFGGQGNDQLFGGNGDDELTGGDGADRFDGGGGDDVIVGGAGNDIYTASNGEDIYQFGYGGGSDTYKGSASTGIRDTDTFVMEDDVVKEALWFERDGDDLVMRLLGTEDSVTFENWYSGTELNGHIKEFQVGDAVLTYNAVDSLISAMAAFVPNDGVTDVGVTADDLPDSVQLAVNSAWQTG